MDDLGQIIQTAIVVVIVVLFIAFVMAELFYKGRKSTIHAVYYTNLTLPTNSMLFI